MGLALPIAAASAVFLFACGSSSVEDLMRVGRPGRWAALLVLVVAAAWRVYVGRARFAVDRAVVGATAAVVVLAFVSSVWSVDPKLTFERAVTLGVLALAALLVAQAVAGRRQAALHVLGGLVAGSVLVALAGLVVLAVSRHAAVAPSTAQVPARYRGMGQDPNTASLLFAVAMPAALALSGSSRSRARRAAAASLVVLFGSSVASGSHGALLAGCGGSIVVVFLLLEGRRARATATLAIVAVTAVGFWIETLPKPNPSAAAVAAPLPSTPIPAAKAGYFNAEVNTPLDGELGVPLPGHGFRRTLTTSSGRLQAWGGAIRQAAQRPVAGYGFGTESRVFIDRWSVFVGSVPENSYIGIGLQLGVAGLLAFAALLAALARAAVPSFRLGRGVAAAGVGVLAAALIAAVGQSYIYSVGNVATLTVWVGAFLLASKDPGI